ncbi:protein unc-93 homolog A-like [Megalops cyprinoides]|uniref:protein unc-93 homolog A-like n=1 Tax=Megalops cyprinoides TaxID=118141 RepID=UPI001863FDB7|nr:protein unc-93 homolog A-like [Megalops cyprinoides]
MGRNLKNVVVVSLGFLSLFTAYGSLQNLQSSLNSEEGLGVASLSIIYAALILSSIFLPPIIIKNLGSKWTIVVSMACYVTYFLSNIYPCWATLIPTCVILGLGGAPLWSAKCTYLTISANQEAGRNSSRVRHLVNQYFGIFFLLFQSSAVWGNLMSALILGQDSNRGVAVLAMVLVAVFLDDIDREAAQAYRKKREPMSREFLATFRHLKDKRQLLLVPLTVYSGLEQGFLSGDYNKYYVTCALGIYFVGYTMICAGATNSLCSLAFGKLSQYTGRVALFILAAVLNFACIIAFLHWRPHPGQLPIFFVFPALWAMADAVWQTQLNALYGVVFPDQSEAAFSNYRMWESTGFVISFAYSNFLCVNVKLYILIGSLLVSMALYGWVEYEEWQNSPAGAQKCDVISEEDREDREMTA